MGTLREIKYLAQGHTVCNVVKQSSQFWLVGPTGHPLTNPFASQTEATESLEVLGGFGYTRHLGISREQGAGRLEATGNLRSLVKGLSLISTGGRKAPATPPWAQNGQV